MTFLIIHIYRHLRLSSLVCLKMSVFSFLYIMSFFLSSNTLKWEPRCVLTGIAPGKESTLTLLCACVFIFFCCHFPLWLCIRSFSFVSGLEQLMMTCLSIDFLMSLVLDIHCHSLICGFIVGIKFEKSINCYNLNLLFCPPFLSYF